MTQRINGKVFGLCLLGVGLATSAAFATLFTPASKVAKVPHAKDIETYQSTVAGFLLQLPNDGIFGALRVPTIHGKLSTNLPGYPDLQAMGKDYKIYTFVMGKWSKAQLKTQFGSGHPKLNELPKYRMACVLRINEAMEPSNIPNYTTRWNLPYAPKKVSNQQDAEYKILASDIAKKLESVEVDNFRHGYLSHSDKFSVQGSPAWVVSKAVVPTDKACYRCHIGVAEGKPVGHILTILIERKK